MSELSRFAARLGLGTNLQTSPSGGVLLSQDDDEALIKAFPDVELLIGDESPSGPKGTLHVTTRRIVWLGDPSHQPAASLTIAYQQIVMHAVAADEDSGNRQCVYLQLDEGSEGMGMGDDEDEDAEAEPAAEVRFVSQDPCQVEVIFQHMCEGAALNPDSDPEGEEDAELFFDEDEVLGNLPPEQRAAYLAARAEQGLGLDDEVDELMNQDPDRFEDDEEEGEEGGDAAAGQGAAGQGAGTAGAQLQGNGVA